MVTNHGVPGLRVPAFSPSVDSSTAGLLHLPPGKTYLAGANLIDQGDAPKSIELIRSGIVRITHTNSHGRETTVGLRSEGWWMGSSLAIAGVNSLATIVAVTNLTVSSLSIEMFRLAIASDSVLRDHFLMTQCRELLMMQQYIIMQGENSATRLRSLKEEAKNSAWNTADPSPVLKQSEVARLLAITPEHLSRLRSRPTGSE